MNKGGYSTPPQYRNNDYRYPPGGPSRYQPYNHPPPDRFDSRQRPLMHQSDYYPEVNYPSPRQGRPDLPPRDDIPPFPRGRGRDRDFSGSQYNRPSPPPPGPPPLNPPFRDYPPPRYPHPPPYNINNSNSNSSSSSNPNSSNTHQNYSPRERPPPEYPPMRDFHYRQESPKPPPPPLKQPPPNSPNLNYENFNRIIPPENRLPSNLPPPFHRNNDFPINPPNIIDDHPTHPTHPTHPVHPPHPPHPVHPNTPQFHINSPPRTPIHMMPPKQPLPIPQNFHLVMSPMPVLLNPAELESQKLEYEELSSHIVLDRELDYKKYLYDKACRKIDIVQAKLDAVMNKLSELEAEKTPNSLSSSSSL